jgi:anti-sigma B factor antagonist
MTTGNQRYPLFTWTTEQSESGTSVRLRGEFDMPAVLACESALLQQIQQHAASTVTVELSDLAFIDSTGLRFLLNLKSALGQRGVRVVIEGMSPAVARVFEVAGVDSWLEVDSSRTERTRQTT